MQAMIQQVLSLTPEQINGLPANERAAIMQLVRFIYVCARSSGVLTICVIAESASGNVVLKCLALHFIL